MILTMIVLLVSCEVCQSGVDEMNVLKRMSATFGINVLACQKENRFNKDVIEDFLNYWNESFQLDNANMGCVVLCLLEKLELVEPEGNDIRIDNANAFLMAKESDETTRKALIELYQMCKKISKTVEPCTFGLEVARCFRAGVMMLEWAPDSNDLNYDYNYD